MATAQVAGLPPVILRGGAQLKFEAVDPTTGAAVAGVTISAASLYGRDLSEDDVVEVLWPIWLLGAGDAGEAG